MASGSLQLTINGRPGNPERGISIGAGDLPNRAIRIAWDNIGRDHQRTMVRDMRKRDKTGIVYDVRIRGRKRRHRASAKGQTPASMTGLMASGLDYVVTGTQMEFGSTGGAFYSRFLELGTKKMDPRPGLTNTVTKLERNTFNYFADEIQKQLFQMFNPGDRLNTRR